MIVQYWNYAIDSLRNISHTEAEDFLYFYHFLPHMYNDDLASTQGPFSFYYLRVHFLGSSTVPTKKAILNIHHLPPEEKKSILNI